jgi:hypothetical protein
VVTQPGKTGRMSMTDAMTYADAIMVTTKTVLNSNAVSGGVSRQADMIVYRGRNYIVAMVYDYEFNGYTRALCKLVDLEGGINV